MELYIYWGSRLWTGNSPYGINNGFFCAMSKRDFSLLLIVWFNACECAHGLECVNCDLKSAVFSKCFEFLISIKKDYMLIAYSSSNFRRVAATEEGDVRPSSVTTLVINSLLVVSNNRRNDPSVFLDGSISL